MGSTIIEKIIRNNVGKEVKPGEIVTVNVDRVMIHDIFIPFVASKFEEMGFTKIWDPDKAVLIYDHLVPASQVDDTRHFRIGNEFVEKYGMKNIHRSDGICHQLMTEAGYVKPGNIVFGTSLALEAGVSEECVQRLNAGEIPEVKQAFVANAQSKVILVEFKEKIAKTILKEAENLGAAPYPVGCESKYEMVPLFYRISGTFRKTDPLLEERMIRINPLRAGSDTVIRIIKESIERGKRCL